jgi:two-component system sensor histidine kinase/response regulator
MNSTKSRILVVDDISKNLQVVGTMLRNEGYHVMPATSGVQALERAHAQPPDLILLDLMMPEMDGLEVCSRLKAEPLTRQIPIIFLTASNEMEHLMKGFEAGAVDYITKPFNAPELLARVRTHLELKHARERLREMNEEKNEFMGIAAHDLRNPLGAITGYAEIILEEAASLQPSPPEQFDRSRKEMTQCASRIHETSRRMAEMVQNLLDANRIERGEMQLHLATTDLGPALKSVVESQGPHATAKQQTIHLEVSATPAMALVDPSVTVQVLENLVSNAVKYSPPGKNIFVRLQHSAESVRCEVRGRRPRSERGRSEETFRQVRPAQRQAHGGRTLDRPGFVDCEEDGGSDERQSLVRERTWQGRDVCGRVSDDPNLKP